MTEITTPEKTPKELRQEEVNQYEANIQLYTTIAAGLPSEWPSHLEHLKSEKSQHEAIAKVENLADVELVGKLWAYEAAQASIRSEMVEKAKAEAILNAMKA
jgi:hypothetical protein